MPWIRFPLAAAALQTWLLTQPTRRKRLMIITAAALFVAAADAFFQLATGKDLFFGRPVFVAQDVIRLTGPLKKLTLGFNSVFVLFPSALFVWHRWMQPGTGPCRRLAAAAFCLAAMAEVAAAGDRMALLLMLLGLAVTFTLYRPLRRQAVWAAVAAIAVVGAAVVLHPAVFARQVRSTATALVHFRSSDHFRIFSCGLRVFQTAPVFGVGPKNFRYVLAEQICSPADPALDQLDPAYRTWLCRDLWLHPHSIYLELLAEGGLIGLGLLVVLITLMGRKLWRTARSRPGLRNEPVFFGAALTVGLRLWPIAASASFYEAWSVVHLWWMLGLALSFAPEPAAALPAAPAVDSSRPLR